MKLNRAITNSLRKEFAAKEDDKKEAATVQKYHESAILSTHQLRANMEFLQFFLRARCGRANKPLLSVPPPIITRNCEMSISRTPCDWGCYKLDKYNTSCYLSHFFSLAGREWRRRERRGAVAGHKGATMAADNIYNIRYRVHVKKPQGLLISCE